MGIIEAVNESELIIRLKGGAKICIGGCDDPEKLRGKYLDFVVIDEAATFTDDYVWSAILRPMLADRKGGAIITGTAAGHTFLYKMYMKAKSGKDKEWSAWNFTPDMTQALDEDELRKIEEETEPHLFQQEYWNNFDAHIKGTYWGKEIAKARVDGRVTFLPHDSGRKVISGWDLGTRDDMVIWYAQMDGDYPEIIDCDILKNADLRDACKVVNSKPYNYAFHILPHDGAQRLSDNKHKTKIDLVEELTRVPVKKYKKPDDTDTVNAHIFSITLQLEKCRFDRSKCAAGLDALSLYHPKQSVTSGVEKTKPFHCDVSDAFRTLMMGLKYFRREATSEYVRQSGKVANFVQPYNPLGDL